MIIVQARMGSTRLPQKVMADLNGRPMIQVLHERLSQLGLPFVYAIPGKDHDTLGKFLMKIGGDVVAWAGPENDVAGRFAHVLRQHNPMPVHYFVRLCADSPYAPVDLAYQALWMASQFGYALMQTPSGSIEAVNSGMFLDALPKMSAEEREHVLLYFRRNRLVVDTAEDLERVRQYVPSEGAW